MFTQVFISFFLFLNPLFAAPAVAPVPLPLKAPLPVAAPATEEDGIVWQTDRKLSWEDFQSQADQQERLHAMTSTNIEVQANCYGNQMQYEVKCVFKTKDSWSKNKNSLSLLAHEQLHFDLTEVHARLLRQKLSQTQGLCGKDKTRFSKIVDSYFAGWQTEQEQYDRESGHGLNQEQQLAWETRIAKQLEDLNAFAWKDGSLATKN
jgi:predicted secreted Zn-dependent protease